jgi:8-oxo-dGTP diphosphatase
LKRNKFAGIILVNSEGKVVMQLRCERDFLYPSCWTLPGGRVEKGESPELAIVREVKEELGLDIHDFRLFRTVVENPPDEIVERHIFWGNIFKRTEDMKLGEGVDLKYFALKEILRIKVAFDLKPVIADFLKTPVNGNKSAHGRDGCTLRNSCVPSTSAGVKEMVQSLSLSAWIQQLV